MFSLGRRRVGSTLTTTTTGNHRRTFGSSSSNNVVVKVNPSYLSRRKRSNRPVTVVTAYDYPTAFHVQRAGVDVALVGDSCAMVELGHSTTQAVTLDEMLHHCRAVRRGLDSGFDSDVYDDDQSPERERKRPLLCADMPLGSYESGPEEALRSAHRFVKEAGADAVKLEGGSVLRAAAVDFLVREGGVAVMGHVGLTPQSVSATGGFRAQGRTARRAAEILDDARRVQDAGAFAVVLECVPANLAAAITEELDVPTIGIGAGPRCDGQVLVFHDMMGMTDTDVERNRTQWVPSFVKTYASLGSAIQKGLGNFKREVEDGVFPGDGRYSPFRMPPEEEAAFEKLVESSSGARKTSKKKEAEIDDATTKLYGS